MTAAGVMMLGAVAAAAWAVVGWWLGRRFEGDTAADKRRLDIVVQESKA
jgi:hypothetical protein